MKKYLLTLSAAMIAMALTSCGSKPAPTSTTNTEAPEVAVNTNSIIMELPATEEFLLDDFEDGNYFEGVGNSWDQWGSHNLSLTASLSKDWKTTGEYSLKCTMEPATAETSKQATWCCYSPIESDLSAFNWCAVDVYVPGPDSFNLSIAVQNGIDWAWDQSDAITVEPGTHTLVFDLNGFSDEHLTNVYCFMIQQCEIETNGTVIYFDNFRLYE
ncbi:MAG: hypothetical protein MJ162_07685 [Treponema sp.]|nr:hypothetical protein [Treponema sp.]